MPEPFATASGAPFLELRHIVKSFDGVTVLKQVDFTVTEGEIIGLIGENGAGKSTCMNIIAGELAPNDGDVLIDGKPVRLNGVSAGLDQGIRFIHQELSLVGALTVAENIFLGDYASNRFGFLDRKKLKKAAAETLARVRASHIDPLTRVETLRAGDQQMVEIAKALAHGRPRLLIMDEPTSSLTEHEASALFDLASELAAAGTAIIFITHRLEEIQAISHRVVVLRDGEKVAELPVPVSRETMIAQMVGKESAVSQPVIRTVDGEPVLRVNDISDGNLANIVFELRRGEILGLFGLVGSGRTELLEILFGIRPKRRGELWLAQSLNKETPSIRMVTESRKTSGILPLHSVADNVAISAWPQLQRGLFINRKDQTALVEDARNRFRIRVARTEQPITSLSGGNQQKALLARAFAAKPDILLLDEPTHGVDVGAKGEIYTLIRQMADAGMAIILASSEVPELMAIVDRCVVLSLQQQAGILTRDQLAEEQLLKLAFSRH